MISYLSICMSMWVGGHNGRVEDQETISDKVEVLLVASSLVLGIGCVFDLVFIFTTGCVIGL